MPAEQPGPFWRFERFLAKSRPIRRGKFSPGFDAARKVFPCNTLRITRPPALAIHSNEGYVQQLPGAVGARCFAAWSCDYFPKIILRRPPKTIADSPGRVSVKVDRATSYDDGPAEKN
jgi:hypothetical protein